MAGIFSIATRSEDALTSAVQPMVACLAHRGPDDSGIWVDARFGIGLGFRRLAIVDLSAQGHQPMRSASGRFTIVFNGEVYNHCQLRTSLEQEGWRFRGHSDTEVMLAAFERWGVRDAVTRFVGMFALAVWDAETASLSLVRDRLGIKPLFVSARSGAITFGSELKALVAGPGFDRTVDTDALTDYLRYLYVPGPRTIYRHACKLRPGHMLTITDPAQQLPESVPYWSPVEAAQRGLADPFRGSDEEAVTELRQRLAEAVEMRLQADVPLGALLSGGIDSSVVVALAQAACARPIKTFSVAFEVREHNEAPHAARVASYLGTDHTEVLLTGEDALAVVPRLPEIFDEPYADTSQIPAFLICGVARKDVVVALSGDGGDEVYGGYNRYIYGEHLLKRMIRVPRPARQALAAGIGALSPSAWDRAYGVLAPVLPSALRHRLPGEKLHKMSRLMRSESVPNMYRTLVSAWSQPEDLVIANGAGDDPFERQLGMNEVSRLLDRMMLTDQLIYMVDDQLAKVDRVSMAVSLEARVPLIDHRLVEFAWRLPAHMKIRDGQGKWLLRQLLYRLVPSELVDRPKMGLSVPLDQWLRGPLRPWAEDLLSADRLRKEGVLHAAPIRAAWSELIAGRSERALGLWAVLMFQAWRARWLS
ncbi:MAG TPA: asparagine synthase (glutamine-hydrolyzing) [Gemmatimonadaceae bacterium]|nr:asparagine synthase (glutamine-hydrolyzing) [Gemmatimonadaceae bacterium]